MNYNKEKWIYICDNKKHLRYVLGIQGERSLLCFGVNPSTAKPKQLDNTVKSVERLAYHNGYDSWIMMNLYPQIATDPNYLHGKFNTIIQKQNLNCIQEMFSKNQIDIWAAWGTLIEKRSFLKECLFQIYELSQNFSAQWLSVGKITKCGHPHHPLYLRANEKITDFDIEMYVKKLKIGFGNQS